MIDWHSHVLPAIDDGSHSIAQSLEMLGMLKEQGVDTVIATPHFYANDESVDEFLERRERSAKALRERLADSDLPSVHLGAEVRYYPGISRMEGLNKLCIEGTKLLLLEMSFNEWSASTVRELSEIISSKGIKLILAHIERYYKLQNESTWDRLYSEGIIMQVNATFFTSGLTKRRALSMLESSEIHLLGSDCHNTTTRQPQLGRAYELISKKLGDGILADMDGFGRVLLGKEQFVN